MGNILDFKKCANCGACYNACPTNAITVAEDSLFYTLKVNEDLCVHCGVCKNVCPVNTPIQSPQIFNAYGLVHNNEQVLMRSSSGGAFSAIAEYVIENNGIVFGAAFSKDYTSVEFASSQHRPLDDLMRSKYVESKVGYSFREAKKHLVAGRMVLYCGAPCQISGLKHYLGKFYSNLITCDFSCGGFPSHQIYSEYISNIEKRLHAKICDVNFRPKTYGWVNHSIKICAVNGKQYVRPAASDPYFAHFIGSAYGSSIRDYCLNCDFANNHSADIILADLWKYKTISRIRNDNRGISLVITTSEKGEEIINAIADKVALTVLDVDKATYNLKEKKIPQKQLDIRKNFMQLIKENGISFAIRQTKLQNPLKSKIKCYVKKLIRRD